MAKLSVLMSVYMKEKPKYVRECFNSLLRQTVKADEWVVVEDGPLSDEMYCLLDEYQKMNPGLIKRVHLERNKGLGLALREGVRVCKNELIARMDTDDIARDDRFEKQLELFTLDEALDICGSNIDEFEDNPNNIVAKRNVPAEHKDIVKYQKRRDAFNHMTVMYRKQSVLRAGNYESCPLMEDTYLWARMIMNGVKCKNIEEALVFARVGRDMFERRGGWSYFKKYKYGKKKILQTGFINKWDYYYTVMIQFVVALIPRKLRSVVFKKILHR